jgi:hypothetical protein
VYCITFDMLNSCCFCDIFRWTKGNICMYNLCND